MPKNLSRHSKFRLFAISIVTLPAFGILLWRGIPALIAPPPLAPTIALMPMPINVPLAALKTAPDKTASAPAATPPANAPGIPANAPIATPPGAGGTENIGAPVRVRIPSIGVNALIEPVALTATAAMDTQKIRLTPVGTIWVRGPERPAARSLTDTSTGTTAAARFLPTWTN